ncbi:hypothetical protein JF50_10460 [Pseudoalteromonas luteoviolacea]|uniref:Uncharacterized protein n=1 Tax=Pseudoalteromonas luteoviolacea TaxID=43657 RepID=A0A0C1MS84_9GAMM|nr:hypothetical protein [Pseudoalteromonas luteoviolacea]KID57593.1 hypothetical protein JF50_10460 [Pseudoalteromonas luteoviolacea]
MKDQSITPAKQGATNGKKKFISLGVVSLMLVAGISVANVGTETEISTNNELNARNGGPSIPPEKPSDSKSILEIFSGLVS